MAPRGDRETTSGHLGKNLVGREEEEAIERALLAVGYRRRWCCRMVSWNSGADTGDAQMGEQTCVVGGDSGKETGDVQVGI